MSWTDAVPALLVAGLVLFVPGLVVLAAGRLRGLRLWALAVPTTFTLAGLGAIGAGLLGIGFSLLSFTALVVITGAIAGGVAVWIRRNEGLRTFTIAGRGTVPVVSLSSRASGFTTAAALAVAAILIGGRLISSIGTPTAIAQLFDNVFHLNAVALIHSTGDGSSLTLGNLTPSSPSFYPAAFHDVTALVMGAGVGDVSVALNAVTLVLAAVVWPLALMYLATALFGRRTDVLILTAVLAGAFTGFPYRMLSYGVLYPFFAGLTMVCVVVALIIEFFGSARTRPAPTVVTVALLLAAAPGIALTHPSVIVAALLFGVPFALAFVVGESFPPHGERRRVWAIALGAAYVAGAVGVFLTVRPPLNSAPWVPIQNYREAIGAIVTVSPGVAAIAWGLAALAVAGFVRAARHPRRYAAVVGMFVIGGVLYFGSAAVGHDGLRDLIAGVWYRDTERIGAVFTVAAFPLVLAGALAVTALVRSALRRFAPALRTGARTGVAVGVVALLVVLSTLRGAIPQAQEWLRQSFGQAGAQQLLSDDERELMQEARELVPADGVIVGDPRMGGSLTPAFADRAALAPHIFGERTDDELFLLRHWDEAGEDPGVCEVIEELNAFWALDFGTVDVMGGTGIPLAGLDNLGASPPPGITEIARIGDAALYEATACIPAAE